MLPVPVRYLLTHENPDVDAMLSVLIIKRFGEPYFPGVASAEVVFCPAGQLPNGKIAEALEEEGILAVDVGGGRFDTHPVGNDVDPAKRPRCAADLVAESVGILHNPYWEALIEYVRLQDTEAQSIHSKDYVHHLGSLPSILSGLQLKHRNDSASQLANGLQLLDLVPLYLEHKEMITKTQKLELDTLLVSGIEHYLTVHEIQASEAVPEKDNVLAEWLHRLLNAPQTAFSPDPIDEIISLPALLAGLWLRERGNEQRCLAELTVWLDAIYEREHQWTAALRDFDDLARIEEVRHANVVSVVSENGLVIKAARYRVHADLILYRAPHSGATSILLNRRGPLAKLSMRTLSAKVRLAECIEEKTKPEYDKLSLPGMLHKWFLHQSENLLICGSLKANDFSPSLIDMQDLTEIALTEVDWSRKIPVKYCPDDFCLEDICPYYSFHLPTCKHHRQRIRDFGMGNTLAYKLTQALEAQKQKKK